jgi:predicted nucleotidyltransferase
MSLTAFLQRVVEALADAGVRYMLTGSLAAAYYAVPRATQDVDLVIEAEGEGMERLVQGLAAAGWYVDRDAALEAWRGRGQFNAIEPESGWKADFIVRKERAYSREEFERRERISILGVEVAVASLEDVLIAKLEWSRLGDSALQRRDAVQLLERNWRRLDRAYLQKWINELGLESEWDAARAQMRTSADEGNAE